MLDGAGVSEEDGFDFDGPGVTNNTVRGNRISGFDANAIERNTTNDNFVDGILVGGDDNAEFGICVADGNTDGGGNRATGNGVDQVSFACF